MNKRQRKKSKKKALYTLFKGINLFVFLIQCALQDCQQSMKNLKPVELQNGGVVKGEAILFSKGETILNNSDIEIKGINNIELTVDDIKLKDLLYQKISE